MESNPEYSHLGVVYRVDRYLLKLMSSKRCFVTELNVFEITPFAAHIT